MAETRGSEPTQPLTYEQEVHALLYAAAANTESLLQYFEAQLASETGDAKKLTQKCIDWKRDDLRRIRELIPKAEGKRNVTAAESSRGAPEAAHKFGVNNICEGCGHSLGWIQEKRMDVCDRDPRDWLLEQQRQELILLKSGHVVLLEALRRLTEKMKLIHNDPRYMRIWVTAMLHGDNYDGPNCEAELREAEAAIQQAEGVKC